MVEEAVTTEDFFEMHGLSNEGLQPHMKYNWLATQITKEQWESVWQESFNSKSKSAIKVAFVQPHLRRKLESLLSVFYPDGVSNNEVRKQLALAFAWENCPEALLDPEGHQINWASYGAQVMMYKKCKPKKNVQKAKAEIESKPAISAKGIPKPTLDQTNLKHNLQLVTENLGKLENKKAEMGKKMQDIVVSLAADEKSNDKIFKTLSEKRSSMERLKSTIAEKRAMVITKEVELEIRDLEKKLMFEEYACESLESVCKPGDPDLLVKKEALEAELIQLDVEISAGKEHASNLQSLMQITSSPFCINTIKRRLPGFLQNYCSACGLSFHNNYKMSVVLECEHEYHVMCAALFKEGRCLKCDCNIPEDLYIELGMSTPTGIEQVASFDPKVAQKARPDLGSNTRPDVEDVLPDQLKSPSTSTKRRLRHARDEPEILQDQSKMTSPRQLRSNSKIGEDSEAGLNTSEVECQILDTPAKKKQKKEMPKKDELISKKKGNSSSKKVTEVGTSKKKKVERTNKKKVVETRKYPLRRRMHIDLNEEGEENLQVNEEGVEKEIMENIMTTLDDIASVDPIEVKTGEVQEPNTATQSVHNEGFKKVVPSDEDIDVSNLTSRSTELQSTNVTSRCTELQAVPMKKKLLILDLNGVLVKTYRRTNQLREDLRRLSSQLLRSSTTNKMVVLRPGVHRFLQEASRLFDLAIWSSMNNFNVHEVIDVLCPMNKKDFVFVWDQKYCDEMPFHWPLESANPVFMKPLHKVYEAFPQYGNNVILADDEVYKTFMSPPFTSIMVPTFTCDPEDEILNSYLPPILRQDAEVHDVSGVLKHYSRPEAYTRTSLGVLDALFQKNIGDEHKLLVKAYCKGQIQWLVDDFGSAFSSDQLEQLQKYLKC